GEQIQEDASASFALERELRRDMPPGDVDVRLGTCELLGEPRQKARAVDQDLDLVARARRRFPVCPKRRGRLEGLRPTNTVEPPAVMRRNERVDPVAEGGIAMCEQIRVHGLRYQIQTFPNQEVDGRDTARVLSARCLLPRRPGPGPGATSVAGASPDLI